MGKDQYSFPIGIGRREEVENKIFISWKLLRFQNSFSFLSGIKIKHIHIYTENRTKPNQTNNNNKNTNKPNPTTKNLRKGKKSQKKVDKDIHLVLNMTEAVILPVRLPVTSFISQLTFFFFIGIVYYLAPYGTAQL